MATSLQEFARSQNQPDTFSVAPRAAWVGRMIGEQQAEMSLLCFLERREVLILGQGEAEKYTETGLRVRWSGPCPYCEGPGYHESIVPAGGGWLIQGACDDCLTRRHAYRSRADDISARPRR
jgi:hypothetical protein